MIIGQRVFIPKYLTCPYPLDSIQCLFSRRFGQGRCQISVGASHNRISRGKNIPRKPLDIAPACLPAACLLLAWLAGCGLKGSPVLAAEVDGYTQQPKQVTPAERKSPTLQLSSFLTNFINPSVKK